MRRKPITMQGVRPRSQPSLVDIIVSSSRSEKLKSRQSGTSLYGSTHHILHMNTPLSFIGLLVNVIFPQKYLPQQQVFEARRFLIVIQRDSPLSPRLSSCGSLATFWKHSIPASILSEVHRNICRVSCLTLTHPNPPEKLE